MLVNREDDNPKHVQLSPRLKYGVGCCHGLRRQDDSS